MPPENDANTPLLESTHALEQLRAFALDTETSLFISLFMSAFGTDVPVEVYLKLQADLHEGNLANPLHQVATQPDAAARFDETTHAILVSEAAIEQARTHDYESVNLHAAMIRAFGEYLSSIIRQDVDTPALEPAERPSHGVAYAAMIFFCGSKTADGTAFATFAGDEIRLTRPNLEPAPQKEPFSAGDGGGKPGSFGHESLEKGLASIGFTDEERRSIYFGNWLRDFSQLLDPKLVRHPDAPKNFPALLSRHALTQLVDLLALKEFHDLQDTPERRSAYTVKPDMLGVYRPSEHIDNPLNPATDASDPQAIDEDFEPLVTHGHALLEVDPHRSMPAYIASAARYMHEKLIDAMQAGNTIEGRRYFGEALHVLEDYFAHSNFVELCLRKRQHDVLPWITRAECKHGLPVVTGMFGGLDVIASIAEPVSKILFEVKTLDFKRTSPGYRSEAEQVLLILLEEHQSDKPLTWLKTYLEWRDEAAADPLFGLYQAASWLAGLPLTLLQNAINTTLQGILGWVGDGIDEFQTLSGHNPNEIAGLHPTHSQLAKDHDTHPFHELAVYLATHAVQEVGRSMYQYWQGDSERDPASVAMGFILHPNDDDWHDDIVAAWEAMDRERSRRNIRLGSNLGELAELQAQLEREEQERVRVFGESFRNAPNSVSDIISNAFPFG
ncbi:HET-C-related protein [Pseudomonas putida]|uniref:Heterokaryon incompatibility protein Het-C n=1 Tax=Pseudomonas putida TaxID=303 RepID=A0A6I6XM37_PSEPU|nr:HET-C-related protein [Pseudomonas putida]QHG66728.2 hypothetical protein C2H86_20935 [Pseudomonas putida]